MEIGDSFLEGIPNTEGWGRREIMMIKKSPYLLLAGDAYLRIYRCQGEMMASWPGEVSDPSVRMTAVTIVTMVTPSWPGADVPIIIITLSPAPHNHHQYKHIKSCPISNNMVVVMEPCYPGYFTTDLRSDSDKMRRRQQKLRYTDQPTRTFPSLTQFLSPLQLFAI